MPHSARRRAAFGKDANALDGLGATQNIRGAGKVLGVLAALADGPHQAGFRRIAGLVDIVAIQAKPGFQPQAVARAQTDGQNFAFAQQGTGDTLGIGAFQRNLKTILAGIAGATHNGGSPRDGGTDDFHES